MSARRARKAGRAAATIAGRTGLPVWTARARRRRAARRLRRKPVAIARDARREQPIGAAEQRVLLVDHGGTPQPRRRQHRRHRGIAAEADRPRPAPSGAASRRACERAEHHLGDAASPCRSSPPPSRPARMRCSATPGSSSAKASAAPIGHQRDRCARAPAARGQALRPGTYVRRCRRLARTIEASRSCVAVRRSAAASAPAPCPCRGRAPAATSRHRR